MARPSSKQKDIIDAVIVQLDYLKTSNDIHSPSHGTDIDYWDSSVIFHDLPPDEQRLIAEKLAALWLAIANIEPSGR